MFSIVRSRIGTPSVGSPGYVSCLQLGMEECDSGDKVRFIEASALLLLHSSFSIPEQYPRNSDTYKLDPHYCSLDELLCQNPLCYTWLYCGM